MFSYFAARSFFLMFSACSLCSPIFLCVLAFLCSSHLLHVLLFFLLCVLSCIQKVSNFFYAFEHMSNSRLSFTHVLTLQILDFHSLMFSNFLYAFEEMLNIAASVLTVAFDASMSWCLCYVLHIWSRNLCQTCHTGHSVCTCVHSQCRHSHLSGEGADTAMASQHWKSTQPCQMSAERPCNNLTTMHCEYISRK